MLLNSCLSSYSINATKMTRVTILCFAVIICLIGSTYGDHGDDDAVPSPQARIRIQRPRADYYSGDQSENLVIALIRMGIGIVLLIILVTVISCFCCAGCPGYRVCRSTKTPTVIYSSQAVGYSGNNGQNSFGLAGPSQPGSLPAVYNQSGHYCESGYIHPK